MSKSRHNYTIYEPGAITVEEASERMTLSDAANGHFDGVNLNMRELRRAADDHRYVLTNAEEALKQWNAKEKAKVIGPIFGELPVFNQT